MADNKDIDKVTVTELFRVVRKGMIWRGKSIENKVDKYTSAKMWMQEEDITNGIHVTKSSAMYDNYSIWCKDRGITGKSMLGIAELGRYLTDTLKTVSYGNAKHYYINKVLKENEDAKKKRQEAYKNRSKKKTDGKETT